MLTAIVHYRVDFAGVQLCVKRKPGGAHQALLIRARQDHPSGGTVTLDI